jgi:UDP-2-acetamido-3-amino-2,3-dideoxy-glucuronate N-acetyltransferase
VFTNVKKPKAYKRGKFEQTLIKKGATIGANATIICGTTIGENATIGAGAVVTRDIPDNQMAWGVPAKVQKLIWLQPNNEDKNGE